MTGAQIKALRRNLRPSRPLPREPKRGSLARRSKQAGGVALEYVLVTTFAAVVGMSLLGLASQVFKHKLTAIATEAGLDLDAVTWNPFAGTDG